VKTILILVFSGWSLFAQTTNINQIANTNETRTVLVTNWAEPGPFLRVVNGQLYNTYYSKLWLDACRIFAARPHPMQPNPWNVLADSVEVEKIDENKIICGVYETEYTHETYTGSLMPEGKTYLQSIVIYHYPNPLSLVSGQVISGINATCRVMRVENYITNGISYEAYDCGLPYTNRLPVVQKVKMKQQE